MQASIEKDYDIDLEENHKLKLIVDSFKEFLRLFCLYDNQTKENDFDFEDAITNKDNYEKLINIVKTEILNLTNIKDIDLLINFFLENKLNLVKIHPIGSNKNADFLYNLYNELLVCLYGIRDSKFSEKKEEIKGMEKILNKPIIEVIREIIGKFQKIFSGTQ